MRSLVTSLVAVLQPALAQAQAEGTPTVMSGLPHDLSVWGMFTTAAWLAPGVMVGLAVASVVTWTLFVAKSLKITSAVRRQREALAAVDEAASLDAAPTDELIAAARAEQKLSIAAAHDREGMKERVGSRLERLEAAPA